MFADTMNEEQGQQRGVKNDFFIDARCDAENGAMPRPLMKLAC